MYEMYSDEGDRAVANLMIDMEFKIAEHSVDDVKRMLEKGVDAIAKSHGEIYDTEPRHNISRVMCEKVKRLQRIDVDKDYWGLV